MDFFYYQIGRVNISKRKKDIDGKKRKGTYNKAISLNA